MLTYTLLSCNTFVLNFVFNFVLTFFDGERSDQICKDYVIPMWNTVVGRK